MKASSLTPYQQALQSYSPSEIHAWVLEQPGGKEALAEGYSDEEVANHLGGAAATGQAGGPAPGGASASAGPSQLFSGAEGLRLPLMYGSELLKGLDTTLGLPGDAQSLIRKGVSAVTGLPDSPDNHQLPTSSNLLELTGRLGLTDRNDLIPGWGPWAGAENIGSGMARGVGSTLPTLPLGGEGALLPALAAGAGGGALGEVAHQVEPDNPWASFTAGATGGALLGGAAGLGARSIAAMRGQVSPIGATFQQAGLPLRSPALTSESVLTRGLLGPFAPRDQTHADIGNALSSSASNLGGSVTLQDAGTYAQKQARDWLATTMPAKEALAWGPVDRAIPAGTNVPIRNFRNTLDQITNEGGSLQALINVFQPGLPPRLQGILSNLRDNLSPTIIERPGGSITSFGIPTWTEVRALRSAVGNALKDPKVGPDAGEQNLKALYSALTKDLSRVAKDQGAGDLFAKANTESTRLHSFAENIVDRMVSGKTPSAQNDPVPEKVAAEFLNPARLKKGGTDLATLNTELPDVTKEFSAAYLHNLATPPKSGTLGKNFSNNWAGLSPEAKAALFDSKTRGKLEALHAVAGKLAGLPSPANAGNHTGAGGILGAGLAFGAGGAHHLLTGQSIGLENLLEFAGGTSALGGVLGGIKDRVLSRLANSPTAARLAAAPSPEWLFGGQLPAVAALGAANELEPRRKEK